MRGLLLDMEPGSKSVPARTRLRRRKISLHAHIALRRILIEAIHYNGALRRQRSWSRITSPTRTQTHHDQRAKNEGRFERATSRTGGIAAREDSKIKSRRSCLAVQTSRLKRRGSNLDVKFGRQAWASNLEAQARTTCQRQRPADFRDELAERGSVQPRGLKTQHKTHSSCETGQLARQVNASQA